MLSTLIFSNEIIKSTSFVAVFSIKFISFFSNFDEIKVTVISFIKVSVSPSLLRAILMIFYEQTLGGGGCIFP